MKQELQQKLFDKYPKIFKDHTKSMSESCMHWGIEVGDGWYNIIDALCNALSYNYTTAKNLELDGRVVPEGMKYNHPDHSSYFWKHEGVSGVVAEQVKEKFGTLRFYFYIESDEKFQEMAKLYPKTAQVIYTEQRQYADGIVRMAEAMSEVTCEYTGLSGEPHVSGGNRRGWIKVLNREFAKTNEDMKSRNYVPVADLKEEEELPKH